MKNKKKKDKEDDDEGTNGPGSGWDHSGTWVTCYMGLGGEGQW